MPIPLVKDPAVLELENIVKTQLAMPCSFIHANLMEANYGVDELTANQETTFPVFILLSYGRDNSTTNEADDIIRKVDISGFILTTYDTPTSEYKSADVEPTIYQMRQLGWNLKYWMNKSKLSNGMGQVGAIKMTNIYAKGDRNLFGVTFETQWTIDTVSSGYLNRAY